MRAAGSAVEFADANGHTITAIVPDGLQQGDVVQVSFIRRRPPYEEGYGYHIRRGMLPYEACSPVSSVASLTASLCKTR